ncbi:hypothetical protein D3C78_1479490 [compost metagenome]
MIKEAARLITISTSRNQIGIGKIKMARILTTIAASMISKMSLFSPGAAPPMAIRLPRVQTCG